LRQDIPQAITVARRCDVALTWTRERAATWDADKQRIVGEAPAGIFDARYRELAAGAPVPGEWWRVEQDGKTVGFGWLEVVWGDAEILLAVAPGAQGKGVGEWTLQQLEREARSRGLRYLYNTVRSTHPRATETTAWLIKRGFKPSSDGALRAVVR
jgi:ribosomal protein S18 acetylase RimI-like enzyme